MIRKLRFQLTVKVEKIENCYSVYVWIFVIVSKNELTKYVIIFFFDLASDERIYIIQNI